MGLKKPVPANLQGQVESFLTCGATLLGENHPLSAYHHMPDLFTGFRPGANTPNRFVSFCPQKPIQLNISIPRSQHRRFSVSERG